MNGRHEQALPPALTHYFDPPQDHVGEFGWVCGYSADAAVLDDALERFTGQTHAVRANEGSIAIALILDPGNEQITPVDVPGLLHLPYIEQSVRPFRLQHAKVALLGFRHERTDVFVLRLVVSTGNWTFDTLERSIDLVWHADISSGELADPDAAVQTTCADIAAAADFFSALRDWFDDGLLSRLPPEHAARSATLRHQRLEQWIAHSARNAGKVRRFVDNRGTSLLEQLPGRVTDTAGGTKRNRLWMGSGFFEIPQDGGGAAPGLASIVDSLRGAGLLTRDAEVAVFANRATCQGLRDCPWPLYEGRWLQQPERTLHAKFIFSGFEQSRSDSCGSAWLYLGSGNLTGPGLLHRAHPANGNLEAGVVLAAHNLVWSTLARRLPVAMEKKLAVSDIPDVSIDSDERDTLFVAAPVHAFVAVVNGAGTRLLPQPPSALGAFDLLDADGKACAHEGEAFVWNAAVPRMLDVTWRNGDHIRRARVPVLDEFGRVAGAELPMLTLDDAWDELANFPVTLDEPRDGEELERMDGGKAAQAAAATPSRYTVRRAMELVERIAAAQCDLPETEWTRWCLRLEQTLVRTAECDTVGSLPSLGYNVLSPLVWSTFRPDFSLRGEADRLYREALAKVAAAWRLHDLPNLELQG